MARVRHIYKQIIDEAREARQASDRSRRVMQDVYTYLSLSKTLIVDSTPLPPSLEPLRTLLDAIDVGSVKEVMEYAVSDKIRERIGKAVENCEEGHGEGGRELEDKKGSTVKREG